ncbi:MAG: VCBS repeat-containing protein, partial [Bacteroidota bacterium]
TFDQQDLTEIENNAENAGSLLFDADGDGDNDLYLAKGSGQLTAQDKGYQDVLYLNDGRGNFELTTDALPELFSNASCVKAADFDQDGDLDLFVGGSVKPSSYPYADQSYLLRNDSQNGQAKFTNVTAEFFLTIDDFGIVSDALWTDFNGDFLPDLIIASKWKPLQLFENNGGQFNKSTNQQINNKKGWWNSLAAADLDNDGDLDYIAGNFGENLYYRCTADEPIRVYGKDLDDNGMIDPLISCYWQDSLGNKNEYLYHPRADLINQFVGIRKKYNTYAAYGEATVSEMFSEAEMQGALILEANYMKSVILENKGNGEFAWHELPAEAQFAPIYGIKAMDIDNDNQLDLLLIGNDLGMEMQQGRADAINGLVLLNEGDFKFQNVQAEKSKFYVPQAGIGLASLAVENQELILATQNRANLKVFQSSLDWKHQIIPLSREEISAIFYTTKGKRKQEYYWGSSFMSQSGRHIVRPEQVKKIEIFDKNGKLTRTF